MKRMKESDFYLKKPQVLGWRGAALLIPCLTSAIGFFCFAVLAFGFTELTVLPQAFRTGLVVVGAFTLAFGGEIGTLSNTVEVFRKNSLATKWDWATLVISVMSTLGCFLLAFSALLGAVTGWADWLRLYGPIVIGLLAALDSYGGFCEFGLYLNTFDKRMKKWQGLFDTFVKDQIELYTLKSDRKVLNCDTDSHPGYPIVKAQEQSVVKSRKSKEERLNTELSIWSQDPMLSIAAMGAKVGVSRQTVTSDLGSLVKQERAIRDGKIVKVL